MTKTLLISLLLLAPPLAEAAEQIVPITAATDLRLRNTSATDAVAVTIDDAEPIRLGPQQEVVLEDIDTDHGEIHVVAPEGVQVEWRTADAWMPSISAATHATGRRRRAVCFACRVDPPTLVRAGDFANFSGSHGVSGTATIVAPNVIRVTNLRHDGSAPGLDLRIGLSTHSRKNFVVLRATGRQPFQNATFDLVLPDSVDLNSFDTFTVWCYEFTTIIAEGKFKRP